MTEFRGEIAALSAALLWAVASFLYARLGQRMSPLWLNLTKSSLAVGLILLTLLLRQDSSPQLSPVSFGLLFLSGAVGIGFGDSVFFASLACLGARRALLLEAIAPPLSACLAALFLGETLKLTAWLGIFLTVGGVAWVVAERTPDSTGAEPGREPGREPGFNQPSPLQLRRGLAFGLLAALAQASGAVLSRSALVTTAVSPLWSSLIRLVAGALVLALWLLGSPAKSLQASHPLRPLRSRSFLVPLLVAAFTGTYLGIWLQQTALKYTATGIAQALIATSPLFILPIAKLTGDSISIRAILGVFLALAGIWLLFNA